MGKGSTQRPTDAKKFGDNYDRIFGKERRKEEPITGSESGEDNKDSRLVEGDEGERSGSIPRPV